MEMHASWHMDLLASLLSQSPALPFSLNDGKEHSSPGFLMSPLDYLCWVLKSPGKLQVRTRVCGKLQIPFKQFFLDNPEKTQTEAACTGQLHVSVNRGAGQHDVHWTTLYVSQQRGGTTWCTGDVSGMKHPVVLSRAKSL